MREIFKAENLRQAYDLRLKGAVYFAGGSEILRNGGSVAADTPVVDVSGLLSHEIRKDGNSLVIGAAMTFQELYENPLSPSWLRKAAHLMASRALRNQATIGGNIALLRDDSYLIPSLLAAGATLAVFSDGGQKSVSLEDYVKKGGCSCLILSITVPYDVKVCLRRFARSSSSHSALNIASSQERVCACVRASGIATSLDELKRLEYKDDITGSAEYKRYLALEEAGRLMKEVKA